MTEEAARPSNAAPTDGDAELIVARRKTAREMEMDAADEATRYVQGAPARTFADALVDLGIAIRIADGRYRLARRATTFGPTSRCS